MKLFRHTNYARPSNFILPLFSISYSFLKKIFIAVSVIICMRMFIRIINKQTRILFIFCLSVSFFFFLVITVCTLNSLFLTHTHTDTLFTDMSRNLIILLGNNVNLNGYTPFGRNNKYN